MVSQMKVHVPVLSAAGLICLSSISGKTLLFSSKNQLKGLTTSICLFTDAVLSLQFALTRYERVFPEFTDHSSLHSMTVIDFANRLIGKQIERMNADEIYVLLMACYLHDAGMGITMEDFREFTPQFDHGDYFRTHDGDDIPAVIRAFHHEYSGRFIRKYADLFDFPSEKHMEAVIRVARGHRRTDLMDEEEYPLAFPLPNGNTLCLPYLAALIRLADEIDMASARNPVLLYDVGAYTNEKQILWFRITRAIRSLTETDEGFVMRVDPPDPAVRASIGEIAVKMQSTLDECRAAVLGRTPYTITQRRVRVEDLSEDGKGET